MQEQDLWGSISPVSGSTPVQCQFEDSFSPVHLPSSQDTESFTDEDYVPLDDSPQYIAGLERKLARVQGRTSASRQTESRRLIDALAGSRDTHAHQLINTTNNTADEIITEENEHSAHQNTAVDPPGAIGAMIRRLAPDKVALTHEELCRLLEADFLAKVREAAEEEDEGRESEEPEKYLAEENDKIKDAQTHTPEEKKHSSDEGEK